MTKSLKLGIIGVGRLGSAILKGVVGSGAVSPANIYITVRQGTRAQELTEQFSVHSVTHEKLVEECSYILVAVEPHQIKSLLSELPITKEHCLISVAAGVSLESLKSLVGAEASLVRVMLNSPASIGEAMSLVCTNNITTAIQIDFVKKVFSSIGKVLELDEKYFDIATALSGSGPAFTYYFMQGQIEGAAKLGMDRVLARTIVAQTVRGASSLVLERNESPAQLQTEVTTRGGCTEEGLKYLESKDLTSDFEELIRVTTDKASHLGK